MPRHSAMKRHATTSSRYRNHGNNNIAKRQSASSSGSRAPPARAAAAAATHQAVIVLPPQQPSSSSPSTSPPSGSNMEQRNSFEDFASLDTVIAEMMSKIQRMAQILRNTGSGAACTSTSSIEQAVFFSPTFESIGPLMAELQQDVQRGMRLFQNPSLPSPSLLQETAEKLVDSGENSLYLRVSSVDFVLPRTWQELASNLRIFSISDRQVMAYMRHLSAQTPSALPIFPRQLHSGNTYIMMGTNGAYFFGENFVCRAPVPHGMTRRIDNNVQGEAQNDVFWYEASDTDDESETTD